MADAHDDDDCEIDCGCRWLGTLAMCCYGLVTLIAVFALVAGMWLIDKGRGVDSLLLQLAGATLFVVVIVGLCACCYDDHVQAKQRRAYDEHIRSVRRRNQKLHNK